MSTDSNVMDAAMVEADESRRKRSLTTCCFTKDQQLQMKKTAETAWAADGYIVLSGAEADAVDDAECAQGTVSMPAIQVKRLKAGKIKLRCVVM